MLDTEKSLTSAQKQKIRNQISAQRSRQAKKMQSLEHKHRIDQLESQFRMVIEVLDNELKCTCKQTVIDKLKAMAPDVTGFAELPLFVSSNSAPTGARAIGKIASKRSEKTCSKENESLKDVLVAFLDIPSV